MPSGSSGQMPRSYSGAAMAAVDAAESSFVPVSAPPKAARSSAVAYIPPVPTTPTQSRGRMRWAASPVQTVAGDRSVFPEARSAGENTALSSPAGLSTERT